MIMKFELLRLIDEAENLLVSVFRLTNFVSSSRFFSLLYFRFQMIREGNLLFNPYKLAVDSSRVLSIHELAIVHFS